MHWPDGNSCCYECRREKSRSIDCIGVHLTPLVKTGNGKFSGKASFECTGCLLHRLPVCRLSVHRVPVHRLPVPRLPVHRLQDCMFVHDVCMIASRAGDCTALLKAMRTNTTVQRFELSVPYLHQGHLTAITDSLMENDTLRSCCLRAVDTEA